MAAIVFIRHRVAKVARVRTSSQRIPGAILAGDLFTFDTVLLRTVDSARFLEIHGRRIGSTRLECMLGAENGKTQFICESDWLVKILVVHD